MDTATNIGFWELSIIMVVIASWLLYRYVEPKGWREWSRAGLIQAFIIALYAEMYGTYRQNIPMFFPKRGEWKKLISTSEFKESEQ